MNMRDDVIQFTDSELKEIFALFSSSTEYERTQIYEPQSRHYFEAIDLSEEYELAEEKREYALDAMRGVLYFLYRNGYQLERDGQTFGLEGINDHFIRTEKEKLT